LFTINAEAHFAFGNSVVSSIHFGQRYVSAMTFTFPFAT